MKKKGSPKAPPKGTESKTKLENELRNKLHGARIVGEGRLRIIEGIALDLNVIGDLVGRTCEESVHSVDAARNVLGVVEHVERVGSQLKGGSLGEIEALHKSEVPVVGAWGW